MGFARVGVAAVVGIALSLGASVTGQMPPFGGEAALAADLAARRSAVMGRIGAESVLVLWSAPPRVYSTDTNYEYRQESNLLYLTAIDQADTILVLVPAGFQPPAALGGGTAPTDVGREFIFVRSVEPQRELWEGRVFRPAEVTARTGIRHVYAQRRSETFEAFMQALFGTVTSATDASAAAAAPVLPAPEAGRAGDGFRDVLAGGRARLMLLERLADGPPAAVAGPALDSASSAHVAWARELQRQVPTLRLGSAEALLETERSIKTPYEQALLRRSVEISSEAHLAGMRATRPGRWEYEVEAAIEYEWHRQGALSWGYPSIVASGPNATILHYLRSTRQMQSGDLLLVDAAGNYQGLTGDITRTYPVNGRFTTEQRALYDLVLQAADAGIAAARPGGQVSDIVRAVRVALGPGLLKLGLVTDPAAATGDSPQVAWWMPHSPTHGIGVDVHDPLEGLDPGAAFVVEPGLYIRPEVLDRLAASAETRALADTLRPVVERYLHIGIRIEDSLLMTSTGPVNMSARVPRRADEVEKIVGTGP